MTKNRGNDGQESHDGEQAVLQRGDQEQGFDRWHNGSGCGSGTWIWNADLQRRSGTWIRNEGFDRLHNGSERGLRTLCYGSASEGRQRLDSRNELRADLRLGGAGLYIQESHATQNPRPRSNPMQRSIAEPKRNAEHKPMQDPPEPPCSAQAELSHRNAVANHQQQRNTAKNNREQK